MSSNSKYVPPHLRNKKLNANEVFSEVSEEKPFEQQYPQLSKPTTTMKVWGGSESFAEKARKWNEHDKLREFEKEEKIREEALLNTMSSTRIMPKFHNVRRFVEEESEEDDDNEKPATEDDDGWTLVQKKQAKKKTPEQIFQEKMEKNSDSEGSNNEDTVWNDEKPSNETYWNEREY